MAKNALRPGVTCRESHIVMFVEDEVVAGGMTVNGSLAFVLSKENADLKIKSPYVLMACVVSCHIRATTIDTSGTGDPAQPIPGSWGYTHGA